MADQTPDLTQMVSSIPKIVITEPSPFREGTSTETSTATSATPVESEATPPTADVGVAVSGDDSKQESDEFKDPEPCEREKAEVVMEVDAGVPVQPSERERNEDSEDAFRDISVENRFERCMRALASFNESKCMLVVQLCLLALPISAGFMGARYLGKCPLSSETPVFLFMMGIAGTIVVISRFLLMSQKILLPSHGEWQVLKVVVIVGNLAILLCLATEMFSFFRTVPSFELGSAHYCHETLYKYTYWANWSCLIVITFLIILQLPYCWSVALRNDDDMP